MKLQIAIDTATVSETLAIVDQIYDVIDIVEVGTPLIVRDGMAAVRGIKERHPGVIVLADTKIVDGGSLECGDACEAGADIVTVLALSDDSTVKDVADTAHKYGRLAMADLICVQDIPKRGSELVSLGIDYVCVHTAVDVQRRGKTPLGELKELVSAIPAEKAAVAGGISLSTIDDYVALKPAIIIAGGALMKADSLPEAVRQMKAKF